MPLKIQNDLEKWLFINDIRFKKSNIINYLIYNIKVLNYLVEKENILFINWTLNVNLTKLVLEKWLKTLINIDKKYIEKDLELDLD